MFCLTGKKSEGAHIKRKTPHQWTANSDSTDPAAHDLQLSPASWAVPASRNITRPWLLVEKPKHCADFPIISKETHCCKLHHETATKFLPNPTTLFDSFIHLFLQTHLKIQLFVNLFTTQIKIQQLHSCAIIFIFRIIQILSIVIHQQWFLTYHQIYRTNVWPIPYHSLHQSQES